MRMYYVLQHLSISQGQRWFRWQTDQLPIPHTEISTSAANIHLIPADDHIRAQLLAVKQGSIITLNGLLVAASDANAQWRSSLKRSDTGAGACEIIWVTGITQHAP